MITREQNDQAVDDCLSAEPKDSYICFDCQVQVFSQASPKCPGCGSLMTFARWGESAESNTPTKNQSQPQVLDYMESLADKGVLGRLDLPGLTE